jgi:cytoskeletal protein CcmA (bactofilin family)
MMKKRGVIQSDSPDRLNVIVEGSKVIGDIITESNLRIDGEVLGNVSSASKVVVGVTGNIKGNLTCSDADIEGSIEGVLKVDSLLTLRTKAVITGEITTSKLHVEEGANFSGSCKMSNYSTKSQSNVSSKNQEDIVY